VVDLHAKKNFERIVRTCDLTQTSQMRLAQNPKLAELMQGRQQVQYFLESSMSNSNHINKIMSQVHANKAGKKPSLEEN